MDSYSLKKDNRKKFQDKQKLKHKHATPSDRKYYNQKRSEEAAEEARIAEEKRQEKLGNNAERYEKGDLEVEAQLDTYDAAADRSKLREVLASRGEEVDLPARKESAEYTSRDIHTLDIDTLNSMLGHANVSEKTEPITEPMATPLAPTPLAKTAPKPAAKPQTPNPLIPTDLADDQDFLDGLI